MIIQTHTLYCKINSIGVVFSNSSNLFSSHPLAWACMIQFYYPLCLFPLYLNRAFVHFNQISVNIYLMYLLHITELQTKITT